VTDDRTGQIAWWHLIAHAAAFCVASGVAAIVFYPLYPKFEQRTNSTGDAFGAFLTFCVIFGGLGPLVTLAFFAAQRFVKRRRAAVSVSRKRRAP
jgi:predicted PurR-regulated permease PerM